jgi:hypothetical protein
MKSFKACNQDKYPLWFPEWIEYVNTFFWENDFDIRENIGYPVAKIVELTLSNFSRNIYMRCALCSSENLLEFEINAIQQRLNKIGKVILTFEEYKKKRNLKFVCERQLNLLEQ